MSTAATDSEKTADSNVVPFSVPKGSQSKSKNEDAIEFGRRLRAWRESQGLSQAELGARAGVRQTVVSNYERGNFPEALKLFACLPPEVLASCLSGKAEVVVPEVVSAQSEQIDLIDTYPALLRTERVIDVKTGNKVETLRPLTADVVRQFRQSWKCVIGDAYKMLMWEVERKLGWSAKAVKLAFRNSVKTDWRSHGPLAIAMALARLLNYAIVIDPFAGLYLVHRPAVAKLERITPDEDPNFEADFETDFQ